MKIDLEESQIKEAICDFIKKMGLELGVKNIEFKMGRKNTGLDAKITFLAPGESAEIGSPSATEEVVNQESSKEDVETEAVPTEDNAAPATSLFNKQSA